MTRRQERAVGMLAMFCCLLCGSTAAQSLGSLPEPAGAAECNLYLLGGKDRIRRAGMSCSGPTPMMAINTLHLKPFQANFTGVTITRSCNSSSIENTTCLLTICGGRLQLKGSRVSWVRGIPLDAVVCVVGNSTLIVHNSRFTWNNATPLGVHDSAQLLLHGSTVSNNVAEGIAGGIYADGHANITIDNGCMVHNNTASQAAGGLAVLGNASATLDGGSSVYNNTADDAGGLGALGNARVKVTGGSRVSRNTAIKDGGGLSIEGNASLIVSGGSSVSYNAAGRDGGGLTLWGNASVTLTDGSCVHSNRAGVSGGGLAVWDNATFDVSVGGCVCNNSCGWCGGGLIASANATVTLFSSSVEHNRVIGCKYALSAHTGLSCPKPKGGGMCIHGNASVTLADGSMVQSNQAVNPDALIASASNCSAGHDGYVGFVWIGDAPVPNFIGCNAPPEQFHGGGLAVDGNATLTLIGGSSVRHNSADSCGGQAVSGNATVTLAGKSSVQHNTANSGGGMCVDGKATIALDGGSSVFNNIAVDGSGGGLTASGNVTVTISGGSSVVGNTAYRAFGGGIFVGSDASVTITGRSSVHGNAAWSGGGLYAWRNVSVNITDASSFHSNIGLNGSGGGISAISGSVVVISGQSTVSNNTCIDGVGGGVAVDDSRYAKFDDRGRSALDLSVANAPSHVTIINSTVSNNTSIRSAGGGIALGGRGTIVLANGTLVSHNSAVNSSSGGAVVLGYGVIHVDDSVRFVGNSISKGYVGSNIAAFDNSTLHLPSRGHMTKCSVGVYLGQSICQAGEVMQHDICVCCPQHTFSLTNIACEPCPDHGKCFGGSLVEPLPGFWSSASTSVQMHRCPLFDTACNYTGPGSKCNVGYTGPLCGECQLPAYGMLSPFMCGKCMPAKLQLVLYLLCSFAGVVFIVYTVHATWRDNLTGTKAVLSTDLIKVLVQFVQYTVIIGTVSVPWPLFSLQRWFQAAGIVFAVASSQALSLDCLLYNGSSKLPIAMQRQLVCFLAPLIMLLVVLAVQWLTWALVRWVVPLVWQGKRGTTPQPALLVLRKLPVTLLVLAFYAYPTLLRASLGFFACVRIDRLVQADGSPLPPGATAPLSHPLGYWASNITQECFEGYHKGWALGLGLPSILLWCIIVPVAMGVGLYLCRAKASTDSFREHFGFLYRNYRPERVWWEAVWAARTVVLTLISVFTVPMNRYFSVLALLMVFWASAVLQNVFRPYAFPTLHRMHMVSTSCLAATTVGALAIFAYDIQDPYAATRLRIAIAVLVLLVNVLFVAWCLWQLLPVVKEWSLIAYSMAKSCVLWVVAKAPTCTRCALAGSGKRPGHRGAAASNV